MTWFQVQSTISAHRAPRKLDVPRRNVRLSPSAESKNHHKQQQQLKLFNHLKDLRLSWDFVFSARNLHWSGCFIFLFFLKIRKIYAVLPLWLPNTSDSSCSSLNPALVGYLLEGDELHVCSWRGSSSSSANNAELQNKWGQWKMILASGNFGSLRGKVKLLITFLSDICSPLKLESF